MTVWMHKGGEILLRHKKLTNGLWIITNGNGNVHFQRAYFFRENCVYIGRF